MLPFANPLGDEGVEYLCDGITESLIRGISRLPSLTVKPRSAVSNFKGKTIDAREAGRRLSADAVVAGTVVRRSGRVRIEAALVSVETGARLWSGAYDRAAGDVLGALNEIAASIVRDGVRLELTGEDRRQLRGPTANAAAYELYLRAIHSWGTETEASYLEARGSSSRPLPAIPLSRSRTGRWRRRTRSWQSMVTRSRRKRGRTSPSSSAALSISTPTFRTRTPRPRPRSSSSSGTGPAPSEPGTGPWNPGRRVPSGLPHVACSPALGGGPNG